MISFTFGRGTRAIEGAYTSEDGIVMETSNEAAQDLGGVLQNEIDYLIATSPQKYAGAYAMALRVLNQWGVKVDTSKMPKSDPDVVY